MIALTVPGEPCGKARPRFTRKGFAYTPAKTRNNEATIRQIFAATYSDFTPLDCAIQMTIIAYMTIPASVSPKVRVKMLAQQIWPTKKPDADNLVKLVADALNGLAYLDDKQVVSVTFHKVYSDRPRLEINIFKKEDCVARY